MTNKEKYGDLLVELSITRGSYALENGIPMLCRDARCKECDFHDKSSGDCKENVSTFREWLNSEYKEPPVDWSKVAVDTPILVKDRERNMWIMRYFVKYENGLVYAWSMGTTSWSVKGKSDNAVGWKYAKLAESERQK